MTFISNEKWRKIHLLLKQHHIDENDISESYVLGQGAGGQKINKTNATVQLNYDGHQIIYGKSRHRDSNRYFARKLLLEKVLASKGVQTKKIVNSQKKAKQKKRRKKKAKIKYLKNKID